jgi:plastocyanin
MFSSTRGMVSLVAVGAVLITAFPALALSQDDPDAASYTAFDSAASGAMFRWYVSGTTATDVTIAERGTVTFTNPSAASRSHNVDFVSDTKPQCKLSTDTEASTGPMPPAPVAGEWTGTCTFDEPGTYEFVCDNAFHPNMTGTITVTAAPTATTTPVATASPTPSPAAAPPPPPATGSQPAIRPRAATRLAVDRRQRGARVKGSLIVSRPGTRIAITLLSRRRALGLTGKRRVRVGRSVIAAAQAGPLAFSVPLDAKARRALRLRERLAVVVHVKASGPASRPVERQRAVRLRPA